MNLLWVTMANITLLFTDMFACCLLLSPITFAVSAYDGFASDALSFFIIGNGLLSADLNYLSLFVIGSSSLSAISGHY